MEKSVLTFNELASYTGISKSYLYKLTSQGAIPHSKPLGKLIFFNKSEIDTWLLKNRRSTNEEIEQKAATHLVLNKK